MLRKLISLYGVLGLAVALISISPAWADRKDSLKEEVRHELVMQPYYNVFDWLGASVQTDGAVVLEGQVTSPVLKKDAETSVRNVEGVTSVTNNIEVLPLSDNDDNLRVAIYRSVYRSDSPLFKYALQSVGPIHIIVKNGNVTLKGMVANKGDSDLANMLARQVPGSFSVTNELQVETPES